MAGLLDGVLPAIYSAGNTAKRRLNGLLADPAGTMGLGVTRFAEDNNNLLNTMANAYPMAGDKTVLNTPKQNALARALLADKGTDMAMAGMTTPSYRGGHTAPMKDKGNAPLHDLTQTYPDDIYSSRAAQYYGHYGGNDPADIAAVRMMQQAKGKPDMPVTMYRAVPYEKTAEQQIADLDKQLAQYMKRGTIPSDSYIKDGSAWYENASRMKDKLTALAGQQQPEKLVINNGDWVTLSKAYAKEHGEGALNGNYKILSQKVPARKLFTDGNSIQEFGYDESGKINANLLAALAGGGLLGLGGYKAMSGDKK